LFDSIASFDIGSSSVKLICVKRGLRNFEITSIDSRTLDLDLMAVEPQRAITEAIQLLASSHNLSEHTIVFTLNSDSLIFKNISFPFNNVSKIADVLPFELESLIPLDIENAIYDFQLYSDLSKEGDVIVALLPKNRLSETLSVFSDNELTPVYAGCEANSHLACYNYFIPVADEKVLIIDIGHSKTIVDIVTNNNLLFTRTIGIGIGDIIAHISETLKLSLTEARDTLIKMDMDLSSFDNTISTLQDKEINITKSKLKSIFEYANEVYISIIDEVLISIKAASFNDFSDFNRIILTGGGANFKGTSRIITEECSLPVVFMPFLPGYTDEVVRSNFTVVLGTLLAYMRPKSKLINLLKDEFSPSGITTGSQRFFLPAFFISLAAVIFILNLLITYIQTVKNQNLIDSMLRQKFKQYFNAQSAPKDPLKEAMQLLQREKKELSVLKELLGDDEPFMPFLNTVVSAYPNIQNFDIKKLSFDGKSLSIDGEAAKTSELENFRKNLIDTGEFENVTLTIRDTSKSRSLFTLVIKKKL